MDKFFIFTALLLTVSMAVQSTFGYVLAIVLMIGGIICANNKK